MDNVNQLLACSEPSIPNNTVQHIHKSIIIDRYTITIKSDKESTLLI